MIKKEIKVTKQILIEGQDNIYDVKSCIGALTLLEVLKKEYPNQIFVEWGDVFGFSSKESEANEEEEENNKYFISVDENGFFVDMMELTIPTTVIIQEITLETYLEIIP